MGLVSGRRLEGCEVFQSSSVNLVQSYTALTRQNGLDQEQDDVVVSGDN